MFLDHPETDRADELLASFEDWCALGSPEDADDAAIPVATLVTRKLEPWLEEVDAFRAYFGLEPRDWGASPATDPEDALPARDAAVGFPE